MWACVWLVKMLGRGPTAMSDRRVAFGRVCAATSHLQSWEIDEQGEGEECLSSLFLPPVPSYFISPRVSTGKLQSDDLRLFLFFLSLPLSLPPLLPNSRGIHAPHNCCLSPPPPFLSLCKVTHLPLCYLPSHSQKAHSDQLWGFCKYLVPAFAAHHLISTHCIIHWRITVRLHRVLDAALLQGCEWLHYTTTLKMLLSYGYVAILCKILTTCNHIYYSVSSKNVKCTL